MVTQFIEKRPTLNIGMGTERMVGLQAPMRWQELARIDLVGARTMDYSEVESRETKE